MAEQISVGCMTQKRVGPIWLAASPRGLVGLHMQASEDSLRKEYPDNSIVMDANLLAPILAQLSRYFNGEHVEFAAPIDWLRLAPFQRQVLQLVDTIRYGQTMTYLQIARQLGKPGAARAVGRANATNPVPIIIPCHRVLGADGKLQGYGGPGGIETKAWLLRLEGSRLL